MKSPQEVELRKVIQVEGVQDKYLSDLANVYQTLASRLNVYIKDIADDQTMAVDTARAMADIQAVLTESGLYRAGEGLLNEGSKVALGAAQGAYNELYSKELQYQPQAKDMINAIRNNTMSDYNVITQDAVTQLAKVATDVSFGVSTYGAAATQIEKILKLNYSQAETWVRTTIASIHRTATVALGEQIGIDKYMYWGPDDALTREFCEDHIGQVKTMREWASIHNGQIGTVATMGGGFNCRHRLIPVGQV